MKIGLALSGGGVRAVAFHCGVLRRIALDGLLESVTFVSTVSGGSLLLGLISCQCGLRWPTSVEFIDELLPSVRDRLTTATLQWSYVWRSVILPWRLLRGRAHVLARQLEFQWEICGTMQDIPEMPRWIVNAACYETGRNWRFTRHRMGDYETNYVLNPTTPIAEAIAASAAVPGLIGPLVILADEYDWHRYENSELVPSSTPTNRYELWDGGVYDNLAVEPLFKPGGGFRDGFDFLLVSDASAPLPLDSGKLKRVLMPWSRALRLVDIATNQVRSLRAREIIAEFERRKNVGVFIRLGNTVESIYRAVGYDAPTVGEKLGQSEVAQAAEFETTLRRLSGEEFDLLEQHGFEVANATLATRQDSVFSYLA